MKTPSEIVTVAEAYGYSVEYRECCDEYVARCQEIDWVESEPEFTEADAIKECKSIVRGVLSVFQRTGTAVPEPRKNAASASLGPFRKLEVG